MFKSISRLYEILKQAEKEVIIKKELTSYKTKDPYTDASIDPYLTDFCTALFREHKEGWDIMACNTIKNGYTAILYQRCSVFRAVALGFHFPKNEPEKELTSNPST